MSENYALELLKSEQRKLTKYVDGRKRLIREGFKFNHFTEVEKYDKSLEDINKALEILEKGGL